LPRTELRAKLDELFPTGQRLGPGAEARETLLGE
jgi:hypothetical protein